MRRVLPAILAAVLAAALGCTGGPGPSGLSGGLSSGVGSSGVGGSPQDACVGLFFPPGGADCVACLRESCPSRLEPVESGCSGAIACMCPGGSYSASAAGSQACVAQLESPSCSSALSSSERTGYCAACTSVCGTGGSSSSGSSGSGSGSSSGSGSGSGSGGSSGSSGSSSGGGSGSSSGSSCDTSGCSQTVCSQSGTCTNGAIIQYCMASVCLCWDRCYWTVNGQTFTCASCSDADVATCRQAAFAACGAGG